jgi:hypothetical protein
LKTKLVVLTFAAVTVLGIRASAHHSFAATYNEGEKTTINATVTQFLFRNPHSFLQLSTVDAKTGKEITCAVEWGGGGQLGSQGVQRETLRPGDKVVVVGEPGRDPDACRMRMLSIKRPSDGWSWGGTFD